MRSENFMYSHEFYWNGSKYGFTSIRQETYNLIKESRPEWKLKQLEYNYFSDSILAIRGDTLFWIPIKIGYWSYHTLYWGFKWRTLRFIIRDLHIGYQLEGTELRWKNIFKRKPKGKSDGVFINLE